MKLVPRSATSFFASHRMASVALVLALSGCAHQAALRPAAESDSPERALAEAHARSWFVRISTPTSSYEGRVQTSGATISRISGASVPLSDIASVERRTVRGGGAIPGAVLGAIGLGALGYAIGGACESTSGCGGRIVLVAGAVTGGLLGLIAGQAIHPSTVRWDSIWQRRQ